MTDNTGLILKALEFAAQRHKNQFRKGEDRPPYINHPIQVASLLINEGGEDDPVLLVAAILHDVIEDTVDSPEEEDALKNEIASLFGDEVLSITLEVTDDMSLRKSDRKLMQIENAPKLSIRAKKLKVADKILNVRDITYHPPEGWHIDRILEYFDWSEKVVAGLKGVNQKLEDMFYETLKVAREKYSQNSMEAN
jgi:guanosine-3',5'-bis(diphosphate) 3'-pyrophosphohydrolase